MTEYSLLYTLFFKRIEKDDDFFSYYGVTNEEAMEIARERASTYLEEAIGKLVLECQPSVDFSERTETGFVLDFNAQEKLLIPSLMYEMYLNRDIPYLKNIDILFTSVRLNVTSATKTSFLAMYQKVCDENKDLMDLYKNTDRNSGKFISIDFANYDTSTTE